MIFEVTFIASSPAEENKLKAFGQFTKGKPYPVLNIEWVESDVAYSIPDDINVIHVLRHREVRDFLRYSPPMEEAAPRPYKRKAKHYDAVVLADVEDNDDPIEADAATK